ncbi:MAG: glutamyl-tRNA(Gln) amidotransferase subunit C, partial [Parcubacteria group bacterium Greene0416_14]
PVAPSISEQLVAIAAKLEEFRKMLGALRGP